MTDAQSTLIIIGCIIAYIAIGGLTLGLFDRFCCREDEHTFYALFWPAVLVFFVVVAVFIGPALILYDMVKGEP